MVSNTDNIIVRIQADITNLKSGLQTVSKDLQSFKRDIGSASDSASGFDRTIRAISWQTMTSGLLNIGTATIQVYTSMSNLDRIQNQVRASMVSVEKAEDQILRKTNQLAQSIEKYGRNSERATMIQGELETATEQLTVKQERLRLAQDQVNDTYLLFGTNVLNSVVGGIQTVISLKNMLIQRTIASTLVTGSETAVVGLNTIATGNNAIANSQANIQRTIGISSFTGLNISLGANTAANYVNSASQTVLGAAVRANPLMLPLTLATIAVGIGSIVLANSQMTQSNKDLEKTIYGITDSTNSAVSGMGSFGTSVSGVNIEVNILSASMGELIEKSNKLEEARRKYVTMSPGEKFISGDPFGKGKAYNESLLAEKELQKRLKIDLDLKKHMRNIGSQIAGGKSRWDILESGAGKIGDIEAIDSMSDKILTDIKQMITYGATYNEALEHTLKLHEEDVYLLGTSLSNMSSIVSEQYRLNNLKQIGNKEDERSLQNQKKYLIEMEQLKKKTLSEYGFIREGKNRLSFVAGDTNYFMGKDGLPFAGVINKKTNALQISIESRDAFDKMAFALDYSNESVKNGTMTPVEAAQYLRGVKDNLNKQRNITSTFTGGTGYDKTMNALFKGINKATGIDQVVANSIMSQSQNIKRLQSKSNVYYGNALDPFNKTAFAPRSLANILSMQSVSKSTQASYKGLTSAKGRGNKKKRLPSDSVQRENAVISLTKGVGSTTISDLSRLSGIDIMSGIGDPLALFKWVLPSNNQYISPAMGQARNRQIDEAKRLIAERIAMANSIISSGRSFVGQGISAMEARYGFDVVVDQEVVSRIESSTGYGSTVNIEEQVRATLASDEKYYNVDDRLRFTDRLAAISTGATTF